MSIRKLGLFINVIGHGKPVFCQLDFLHQIAVLGKGFVIIRRTVHGSLKHQLPNTGRGYTFERGRIQFGERAKIGQHQVSTFGGIGIGVFIILPGFVFQVLGAI